MSEVEIHPKDSTPPKFIRIFVGSWNVGNAAPPSEDNLSCWLFPDNSIHDIYCIGSQVYFYLHIVEISEYICV